MSTEHRVIYLGRHELTNNKVGFMFLPVALLEQCKTGQDATHLASAFELKTKAIPSAIGRTYLVIGDLDEAGRLVKMVTSVRPVLAPEQVTINRAWQANWEAGHETVAVAIRARKYEKELADDVALPKVMASLRQRYTSTDRIGRLALEVVVLDYLRNH